MEFVTRADALAQGLKHYFTGNPCKHGHVAKRYVAGNCVDCARQNAKVSKSRANSYARTNRSKHPQKWQARSTAQRATRLGIAADAVYLGCLPCPSLCPVLGTPISFAAGQGRRSAEVTASFDRRDPTKGYVAGNVWIISLKANQMKSDASPEQLKLFAEWVLRGRL